MSTDYGIGCRTCRDANKADGGDRDFFSGEFENCRWPAKGLAELCKHPEVIVAASLALPDQAVFLWSDRETNIARGIGEFFQAHVGHVLAPMDEYRCFDGEEFGS